MTQTDAKASAPEVVGDPYDAENRRLSTVEAEARPGRFGGTSCFEVKRRPSPPVPEEEESGFPIFLLLGAAAALAAGAFAALRGKKHDAEARKIGRASCRERV